MDKDTSKPTESAAAKTIGDRQNEARPPPQAARVFPPLNSAATFQISSDYYREVTRTTDIAGRLPNAVYTLPPHIVQAIVGRAAIRAKRPLFAECKKFYLAAMQYEESKEVFVDGQDERITTIALDCGRLYAKGNNRLGQCGIGSEEDEVTDPRLIRLPPVLQVWHESVRWFAKTTRGLYTWVVYKIRKNARRRRFFRGRYVGQVRRMRKAPGNENVRNVRHPRRVSIDSEVLDVYQTSGESFFRTSTGWLGCGGNGGSQLGLGHRNNVTTPTPIPGSEGVTRWMGDYHSTFAFTHGGMLACGRNFWGECGVGSTDDEITTLTPVALPDDVKGRVDRVVICSDSAFFLSGRRCFGCGRNDGKLGIESDEMRTPTPTDLPGPVVKCFVDRGFVQLEYGAWVGRGWYEKKYFIPVPDADLIDGPRYNPLLPGWTPVIDEFAGQLNAREAADNVMFLPEPVANA